MNALEILNLLNKKNITLKVDGEDLLVQAQRGLLNQELISEIRQNKKSLINAVLAQEKNIFPLEPSKRRSQSNIPMEREKTAPTMTKR